MTTPLPPNDPPGTDDRLPGEAELAALYRQLPQREPSPALDAAVWRAAAQALGAADRLRIERRQSPRESGDWVHPKPAAAITARAIPPLDDSVRRRRRVPPWLVALGSTASLVLVAGLAWHMRTAPTVESVPIEPVVRPQPMATATMQTTERADARPAVSPAEAVANQAKRQVSRQSTQASVAPAPAADMLAAPPPAKMAAPPRRAEPASGNAREMKPRLIATPLAMPAAAPALQETSMPPPAHAPAPPAPPAPAAAVQVSANSATLVSETPAQELAKIEQLFAQGHTEEARKQLRAFHQIHPKWPLPPELKAQLPEP